MKKLLNAGRGVEEQLVFVCDHCGKTESCPPEKEFEAKPDDWISKGDLLACSEYCADKILEEG